MEVSVLNQANYLNRVYDGMDSAVVHRRLASSAPTLNRSDRQKRILIMRSSMHVEKSDRPPMVGREGQFPETQTICTRLRTIHGWRFEKRYGDLCTSKKQGVLVMCYGRTAESIRDSPHGSYATSSRRRKVRHER